MGAPLATRERPRTTAEEFRGGWYYPGELGRLDAQYYLFLEGRESEVINCGGAKVHPAEIESVLQQHPQVVEAAVIGRREPDNEESIIAFVIAREPLAASALQALCRSRLTGYKVPREIHLLSELPRNTSGKIDKLELARRLAERRTAPR